MRKKSGSIRGVIIRELLKELTASNFVGKKIQEGEHLEHPIELEWRAPLGYKQTKIELSNCSMELLRRNNSNKKHIIYQIHGGGYIGNLRNVYRDFAVQYCRKTGGAPVYSLDYRTAPDHPYPAALEDAISGYEWLLGQGYPEQHIFLVGDSAGGGLALALCHYLKDKDRKLPRAIVTMSAWTDLALEGESYEKNYEIDPLYGNTRDSLIYRTDYHGGNDPKNPYISPLYGSFEGFPPMLMQVGTHEMLLSDTLSVATKAQAEGVKVQCSVYRQMFHDFQMTLNMIPESKRAWEEVARFIRFQIKH